MDYSTLKGHVLGPSTGVPWLRGWVGSKVPKKILIFLTFPLGRKINDILQLGMYIK
jgi:hypothetical protein